MNELLYLEDMPIDEEIPYTEEEVSAIYQDYENRVIKKHELKMWCKKWLQ